MAINAFPTNEQRTLMDILLSQGVSLPSADMQAQTMTRGLGTNDQGNVGFSGPVAGYQGPLRPEDAPSFQAGADIPVYYGGKNGIGLSPQSIQARSDAGGALRGLIPDAQAERTMQGLQGMAETVGPAAANTAVASVLQRLGIAPSEYQKAFDKEKGKLAAKGGSGGGQLFAAARASAGTPEFAERMAEAAAAGDITPQQQIALERLNDARVKQRTPEEKLTTQYENAQMSIKRLGRVGAAYDGALQGKNELSQNLKLSLSRNANFTSFLQHKLIPMTDKLTENEVKFVTEMNSLLIGMRQMYDDQRMSDQDVRNFLQALGDPKSGPDVFRQQLVATTQVIRDRGEGVIKSLKARGKDISGLTPMEAGQGQQQSAGNVPAVGAVVDGYTFKGGDPSKPESWEKK